MGCLFGVSDRCQDVTITFRFHGVVKFWTVITTIFLSLSFSTC